MGMEAFQSLPEGTLAELIDNVVYRSPSPATRHQKIAQKIFRRLSEQIEDTAMGEVFLAPLDVYLDEHSNAVQPDIVVVLKSSAHIINPEGHIHGVPDVLVACQQRVRS